jgi:hypothetical protein
MRVMRVAAIVFAIVTAGVVLFQFALALGAPWGSFAMGGVFPGQFPLVMRFASVLQAALLVITALVVLSRSGLLLERWYGASKWAVWFVVVFGAFSVVLNSITPSAGERAIWLPVALLLFACSLTVAVAARTCQAP